MRVILLNFMIFALLILAYFTDIFSLFTGNGVLFFSIALVLVLLAVAWKMFGSPFTAGDKNEDK